MMTAMARLPCKQTSPSQQPRYAPAAPVSSGSNAASNFVQSRGYWEMQQQQQQLQQQQPIAPPPPYVRSHHRHHADHVGKRKSAVELLQESKAFYVKSETVLDRKQELKNSGHLQVSQVTAPGAPPRLLRKCTSASSSQPCGGVQSASQQSGQPCCWASCHENDRQNKEDVILSPQRTMPPALPPKSPRLVPVPQRRSAGPLLNNGNQGPSSEQLQAKLRRLLNTDSKENVFFPEPGPTSVSPPAEYATPTPPPQLGNGERRESREREEKFRYSPGGSLSPGCRDDERTWATNQGDVRFKFGRSNSHSHGGRAGRTGSGRSSGYGRDVGGRDGPGSAASSAIEPITAVVCHKSLPDLHTSTRRRASLSPRDSIKSSTRRQQQQNSPGCPDCETGSDYSDRSFNRDSVCYRSYERGSKKTLQLTAHQTLDGLGRW